MVKTITIRLSDELKARIANAAEHAGKSTHSFIVEALGEYAELEEQRMSFEAEASARFANILASGQTIAWTEMRRYLEARMEANRYA